MVMVGMAGFPIGQNDGFWAELTNDLGDSQFVFARGMNIGVRRAQSVAPADAQQLCCLNRFLGADLGAAPCAHLAGGQVENARFITELGHLQQGAAASEFHVVGMGGNGEEIEDQRMASRSREGEFYTGGKGTNTCGGAPQYSMREG